MRFNLFSLRKSIPTLNHESATAYMLNDEYALYTAVVTSALHDNFYETGNERLLRIRELMKSCPSDFIAKLAVYTRTKMHLRSVSLVLLVELAKRNDHSGILANAVYQVVQRADEITELLAYYELANQRVGVKKLNRLSKQVQKGLARSFNKFDAYQFAKYDRKTAIRLRDALFLVHPKPKDEATQQVFNQIASDTLPVPYTWETALSEAGQAAHVNGEEKKRQLKKVWSDLIDSNQLGYMALLRNLRNILQANVSYFHIEAVCNQLTNAATVAKSKQLPFRFLSAYRELLQVQSPYTSLILQALEQAVQHSTQNIRGFDSQTSVILACDVSGSMQKPISPRSTVQYFDIGLMLAMLLKSRCKQVITGMFGDTWKVIQTPNSNILESVMTFHRREGEVGYATHAHKVIQSLLDQSQVIDKVMIFTDVQLYSNNQQKNMKDVWLRYRKLAPTAQLYLFDLAGYGTTPIRVEQHGVHLIAGWSDRVFDILHALDQHNALDVIHAISLETASSI